MKSLTRQQLERRKAQAVRFTRDVREDDDRADEIEDEALEDYAQDRHIKLNNPKGARKMAVQTRRELLDRINELESENEDLQSRLDEISDIIGDNDDNEDTGEDTDNEEEEEENDGVGGNLRVAGEESDIGVEVGGHDVVVARGQVQIRLDGVSLAPQDHGGLAMNFQSQQAIDDMAAGFFQGLGPFDVALFVEAGFEFHEHGHLLAFFDGLEQRFHHRRIAPHAVEHNLDGQDIGIARRLAQKIHHRLKRLERVMQQDVAPSDEGKHILFIRSGFEFGRRGGQERLVLQIGAVDLRQRK